jgi:hypothetical protein
MAIILGANTATVPGQIAIVKTDGSQAGAVTAFTTGLFDPQVVTMGELWWLTNSKLLFTAGASTTTMDFYVHDITVPSTTPLTKTTTGSLVVPFTAGGTTGNIAVRGSFMSDNGLFYYFARGFTTAAVGTFATEWIGINAITNAVFDVTGNGFSGGLSPSIRPVSTAVATWFPRRHGTTNELFYCTMTNKDSSTLFGDDEVWKFNPEVGTAAVQITANNGTATSSANIKRIQDLFLQTGGVRIAYAQGVGTLATVPEDLYVSTTTGGTPIKVSVTPTTGGQGIHRGSVYFTATSPEGIAWVQGTNSRTITTLNTVAMWNLINANTAPVRLTAAPVATAKNIQIFNSSPINP